MTQCFVCRNCKNTIIIRYDEGKEILFCILHMLRIHTGLRNWSKTNVFDLHLKKKNPFDIGVPCIKITKSELLFEQYRMALNWEKYDIEFLNDDAIKHNQILFDFMQRILNSLYGLYLYEKCPLIDTIMKDQLRKQSSVEVEKPNRKKRPETKERKVHLRLIQKILFCE